MAFSRHAPFAPLNSRLSLPVRRPVRYSAETEPFAGPMRTVTLAHRLRLCDILRPADGREKRPRLHIEDRGPAPKLTDQKKAAGAQRPRRPSSKLERVKVAPLTIKAHSVTFANMRFPFDPRIPPSEPLRPCLSRSTS